MNTITQPVESHRVTGDTLLAKVRQLVHEGNVRRLIVKNEAGVTLMEFPLTVGVVGAVLLPVWVALGAIAAVAAHYTIVIERTAEEPAVPGATTPDARSRGYAFAGRPEV